MMMPLFPLLLQILFLALVTSEGPYLVILAERRRLRRALAKPEARQRKGEAPKRTWADPKVRQRWSKAAKPAWSDSEKRGRHKAKP